MANSELVTQLSSISLEAANRLRDAALNFASSTSKSTGIPGVAAIFGRQGMLEAYGIYGRDKIRPMFGGIAMDKGRTALDNGRSTILIARRMIVLGADNADYAGYVRTKLGGGIPLFLEEELVGGMGYSGGLPEEDTLICVNAAHEVGFRSDLTIDQALAFLKEAREREKASS